MDRIKFNSDSLLKRNNLARCGGVCRDGTGGWSLGFCKFLGHASVLMAELWGIYTSLQLAWKVWLEESHFEMDSELEVGLINKGCSHNHQCWTIVSAREYAKTELECKNFTLLQRSKRSGRSVSRQCDLFGK